MKRSTFRISRTMPAALAVLTLMVLPIRSRAVAEPTPREEIDVRTLEGKMLSPEARQRYEAERTRASGRSGAGVGPQAGAGVVSPRGYDVLAYHLDLEMPVD